jgi:DNA-directed RNA polymerase subunit RPC12/RpoP
MIQPGARCPYCDWRLPLFSGEIRSGKEQFACPQRSEKIFYNANIGPFSSIGAFTGTILLVSFLAWGPSNFVKLVAGILASLLMVAFFCLERLEKVDPPE